MVKFCTFWEVPYPWGFISFEITGMGHTVDGNQKSPRPNNHREKDGWSLIKPWQKMGDNSHQAPTGEYPGFQPSTFKMSPEKSPNELWEELPQQKQG